MRKLLAVLLACLGMAVPAFGDGDTPIQGLKLIGPANGNQQKFTNLQEVAAGTARVDTVVLGGVGKSAWPTNIEHDPVAWPWVQDNVISNAYNQPLIARDLCKIIPATTFGATTRKLYNTATLATDSNYMAAVGSYNLNGVRFFDITEPSNVVEIAGLGAGTGVAADQTVGEVHSMGDYILAGNIRGSVSIFDWSDRMNPVRTNTLLPQGAYVNNASIWDIQSDGRRLLFVSKTQSSVSYPSFQVYDATNLVTVGTADRIFAGDNVANAVGITYLNDAYDSVPVRYLASDYTVKDGLPTPETLFTHTSANNAVGVFLCGSYPFTNTLHGLNGSLSIFENDVFVSKVWARRSATSAATDTWLIFKFEYVDGGVTNVISETAEVLMPRNTSYASYYRRFVVSTDVDIPAGATVQLSVYRRYNSTTASTFSLQGGTTARDSHFFRRNNVVYVGYYGDNTIKGFEVNGTNIFKRTTVSFPSVVRLGALAGVKSTVGTTIQEPYLYAYPNPGEGNVMGVYSVGTNLTLVNRVPLMNDGSFYGEPVFSGTYAQGQFMYLGGWTSRDGNNTFRAPAGYVWAYDIRGNRRAAPRLAFVFRPTGYYTETMGVNVIPGRNMIASVFNPSAAESTAYRVIHLFQDLAFDERRWNVMTEPDPVWGIVATNLISQAANGQAAYDILASGYWSGTSQWANVAAYADVAGYATNALAATNSWQLGGVDASAFPTNGQENVNFGTNLMVNGSPVMTNDVCSFGGVDRYPETNGIAMSAVFEKPGTVFNVRAKTMTGTAVFNVVRQHYTNGLGSYTVVYTGVVAGTTATNIPLSIPVAIDECIGTVTTNLNGVTNLWYSIGISQP